MATREIKPGVYFVGAIDWDRELFDELIPLAEGTTYNSYLVIGSEKTALIDTVDPSKTNTLIRNLESLNLKKIDYVISNHAEQDHSGSIPKILELYPEAKVVTNKKCKGFLEELLLIDDERFMTVNEGDTLSLGNKTFEFILTPWVHWPETMSTYLREEKILFSCDFFGSHVASSKLFVGNETAKALQGAKRYYAEIMMPFRPSIRSNLKKVEDLEVDMIAPSHGQIYDNPEIIINAYKDWVSDDVRNKVVIVYISMHGSTERIVERLVDGLISKGITVEPFNVIGMDVGKLAMSLVDAATLVVASPTMLVGVHPEIAYAAYLANMLRPKLKLATIITSYNWGGQAVEQLKGMLTSVKAEFIEPLLINGHPKPKDMESVDDLVRTIFEKHGEILNSR